MREIAEQIVRNRQATLDQRVGRAPSYRAEAVTASVEVVTQERVVDALRQVPAEAATPVGREPTEADGKQQPLILLPAPVVGATESDFPIGFLETLEGVSDRYRPITHDEQRQLLVLIRGRAAARSDASTPRRRPSDRLATTSQEIEQYLDQIRGSRGAANLVTE